MDILISLQLIPIQSYLVYVSMYSNLGYAINKQQLKPFHHVKVLM